jgi:hypothetical protein
VSVARLALFQSAQQNWAWANWQNGAPPALRSIKSIGRKGAGKEHVGDKRGIGRD